MAKRGHSKGAEKVDKEELRAIVDQNSFEYDQPCKVSIFPAHGEPPVIHPYLESREGRNGGYNYYFVPWSGGAKGNTVPDGATWRYASQAARIWKKTEITPLERTK